MYQKLIFDIKIIDRKPFCWYQKYRLVISNNVIFRYYIKSIFSLWAKKTVLKNDPVIVTWYYNEQ